ncbi:MAG TPA: cytochrome c [Terracidiphilus sp.]|nr:cytochrome c [Terracidiphilus sp.]
MLLLIQDPFVRIDRPFVRSIVAGAFLAALSSLPGAAAGKPAPTFSQDVAPILSRNCAKCHQAGGLAAQIPLTTYEAAKNRAASIKQMVSTRAMPPWPADPARSLKFRNDARLSEKDIHTVVAWVDGGAAKGNDVAHPAPQASGDDWARVEGRNPDYVIALSGDVHIPAQGAIPYVRVLVKVPFLEDRWIAASQTKPSNPTVVHHMALTEVALPDGMTPSSAEQTARVLGISGTAFVKPAVATSSESPQPDMLSIYTPGSTLETYPSGSAKLLKGGKNMYVIFNIHYQTTGKPEIDRSRIALWFAPTPPEHQLFRVNGAGEAMLANGKELLTDTPGTKAEGTHVAIPPIQPFEANYELTGVTAYLDPITLYQFHPHAHYRGKDFTYSVVYPDGREQTILTVPRFDHRWQMAYELETPLKLPAGSKLIVTAHYDNSKTKMHNPAPEKAVYFRAMNQSWDEMFTPFIQYTIDDQNLSPTAVDPASAAVNNTPRVPLKIGEVVGCLERGPAGDWLLSQAGDPKASEAQATSSVELNASRDRPLGSGRYRLLGARVFNPASFVGQRVAVKGVLLADLGSLRINVTSLQTLADHCVP